ncbi:endonuclease/exonuclease/phosphatase family protein [Terrimonas pollutisoli]|uniref:endonuclease/exonuclease/phosphatase family protein n=1 Tax=Terrimonas pollutisoli TaxID=3034147 RepID=UPI0023ECF698|nr:endonuclease/exonuclease/phosphatase family protein [Terrimonas sp. H1YJ31]
MKLITWNCNMAFRKKAGLLLSLHPDIVIVPECEHPDKLKFSDDIRQPSDMLWFGNNLNKGLGIFSYSDFRFRVHKKHNPELRMIIPVTVTGGNTKFLLYAIWANNPTDPDGQYVEQIWKAIHHYKKYITNKQTILIGDFNSNTIWDRKRRAGNHSNVVKHLEEKGIYSCYHLHHQQVQGSEQHPTYYLYRHQDKPYHLDYCFVSADLSEKIKSVEIGDYDYWSPYSDHMPVIITLD